MTKLSLEQQIEKAVARELWGWRTTLIERAEHWYPESIFPPVAKGETYKTPDGAAAAMARHVYNLVANDLAERSIELSHDEPEEDQ